MQGRSGSKLTKCMYTLLMIISPYIIRVKLSSHNTGKVVIYNKAGYSDISQRALDVKITQRIDVNSTSFCHTMHTGILFYFYLFFFLFLFCAVRGREKTSTPENGSLFVILLYIVSVDIYLNYTIR